MTWDENIFLTQTNKIQIQGQISQLTIWANLAVLWSDREKAVLWFGSLSPLSVAASQPEHESLAGTIWPIPGLCLLAHCDNDLSQLSIRFFGIPVGLWLFTYLIMAFYYPPSFKQLTMETFTHSSNFWLFYLSIHLALETTGDSRPHVQVP